MLSIDLILLQDVQNNDALQPHASPVLHSAERSQASSGSEASSKSNEQEQVRINCNCLLTLYTPVDVTAAFDLISDANPGVLHCACSDAVPPCFGQADALPVWLSALLLHACFDWQCNSWLCAKCMACIIWIRSSQF